MRKAERCFCLRGTAPKGKNREPGLQENSVRNFTGRRILFLPKFKTPRKRGFNFVGKQANCFACVRMRKAERCFCLRGTAPKGKNREPGLQENSVRNFTGRRILFLPKFKTPRKRGFNFVGKQANCFACVRMRKAERCFCLRGTAPKGKNREPGLQENSVRNFTGRRILFLPKFKTPRKRGFNFVGKRRHTKQTRPFMQEGLFNTGKF